MDRNQKSRKRQRASIDDDNSVQPTRKTKAVTLDALPWAEVPLPDRFEDAEGFFGLEEIDDVEVIRDPSLGTLEYRVGKGSIKVPRPAMVNLYRFQQIIPSKALLNIYWILHIFFRQGRRTQNQACTGAKKKNGRDLEPSPLWRRKFQLRLARLQAALRRRSSERPSRKRGRPRSNPIGKIL